MLGARPSLEVLAQTDWDLIIIGGGITGAGIALEAARLGKRTLLLEQRDFSWGTSSRSSKMVHGGLRYIAQGHVRLTRDALRERERMLRELPDLVLRQTYAFVVREGEFPGRWPMALVLWLYDWLAGIKDHFWLGKAGLLARLPRLAAQGLRGAMLYTDALTDDARLVLRVLHEAVAEGAVLANHMPVQAIQGRAGAFALTVRDALAQAADSTPVTLGCGTVINATGAWADQLSAAPPRIRPLRGSHLMFARARLPVDEAVTALHPKDRRPVFVYPWLGMTCVGTTDLDHPAALTMEPHCTSGEMDYLLALINSQFPQAHLTPGDVVSTIAGVRPVVASGKGLDPSKESREHAVWKSHGVVTVSGGKLTTFRLIALDALHQAALLDGPAHAAAQASHGRLFRHPLVFPHRLGHPTAALPEGDALLETVDWALCNEMVVHLDDLLLRRVRIGNTQPCGGAALLPRFRPLCQARLGWDDARWDAEQQRYLDIIRLFYSVPS